MVLERATAAAGVTAALCLGAVACGGGHSPAGVASLGKGKATTATESSVPGATGGGGGGSTGTSNGGPGGGLPVTTGTGNHADMLKYARCMRSHGVPDFPDPASNGALNVNFQIGGKDGSPVSSGINRNSPQYLSAVEACRNLLPGGVPTPAQTQEALAKGLKFARCMRSHGVANFPDPSAADVVHLGPGVDPSSPQFQDAQKVCQSLVPGSGSK